MINVDNFFNDAKYPDDKEPIGLYVHVPFCKDRCHYCDFVSTPHNEENEAKYADMVIKEIKWHLQRPEFKETFAGANVDSLYFGGGTPSILEPDFFEPIVELCRSSFNFTSDMELTVETNPESIDFNKLVKLKSFGVNRISLGVQSFENDELVKMNRVHTQEDALTAAEKIKQAGFKNFSIDLITGYPGQTTESMTRSLDKLISLNPQHTSIYKIEVKPGTYLEYQIEMQEVPPVDEQLIETFYKTVCTRLEENGYKRYEMSSFAKPGLACKQNLKFWKDGIFLGFGAGAQGMTGKMRYANSANLASYFDSVECNQPPYISCKQMTPKIRFKVAIVMGSYLVEGVDLDKLGKRYNVDAMAFVKNTVGNLINEGYIEISKDNIFHITSLGRSNLNKIFSNWA